MRLVILFQVACWGLTCLLKQEGWYMQNAAIPPHSIPQVPMTHLSSGSQGGVILPNGQVALVGFPNPMRDHGSTAFLQLA